MVLELESYWSSTNMFQDYDVLEIWYEPETRLPFNTLVKITAIEYDPVNEIRIIESVINVSI